MDESTQDQELVVDVLLEILFQQVLNVLLAELLDIFVLSDWLEHLQTKVIYACSLIYFDSSFEKRSPEITVVWLADPVYSIYQLILHIFRYLFQSLGKYPYRASL